MEFNEKFALVDTAGDCRYPEYIGGVLKIGKDGRITTTDVEVFARAILLDGLDGRFCCMDGSKKGILKFSGRAHEAVSYELAPYIAKKLGLPAKDIRRPNTKKC